MVIFLRPLRGRKMSRIRTDLRPVGNHRSPTRLPPVRNSAAVTPVFSAKSREWQSEMVRGVQLHVHSPPSPSSSVRSSSESPREEEKKSSHSSPVESQPKTRRTSESNRDQEKLKQKILSLQKLIEKLREEIRTKDDKILKLEQQLTAQEADLKEQLAKLNVLLQEKQKKIEDLENQLLVKDADLEKLKEEFEREKVQINKEHAREMEELDAKYKKELASKEEKLATLKMHMASALGDNSRERQQQLDELMRELNKVTEEADYLKSRLQSVKPSMQSNCQNCHTMEKELQSKIIDVRDKELAIIELQQVCDKMEKQLVQQDGLLREWAKTKGKHVR